MSKQVLRVAKHEVLFLLMRFIPCVMNTGRNRGLDGLAAAIAKLWEKSEIVKIGVKRGVQNTSNERMAEELKVIFTFTHPCHVVFSHLQQEIQVKKTLTLFFL